MDIALIYVAHVLQFVHMISDIMKNIWTNIKYKFITFNMHQANLLK